MQLPQLGERAAIEDIALPEPTAPGLSDAEAEIGELLRPVRIGRDAHEYTGLLGHAAMEIGKIEPVGMGVQFDEAAAVLRGGDDPCHIDIVGLALADEAPGRMGKDGEMRPVHRAQDALSLLLTRQVELAVDGGDDEVELAQDVVRQVELSVFENIDLDPLQQREPHGFSR